jgi:hypothetical protein
VECWFNSALQQDWCRNYNGSGAILNDGVFLPIDGEPAVLQDERKIGPGGSSYSVHLLYGKVLIPREHFDEIRKKLNGDLSYEN